jgi:hypothetical protein
MEQTILIIPNLYIGLNESIDYDYLDENNIKNIISINKKIETQLNQLNIIIDDNDEDDINYEIINDFIINSFLKDEAVLICDENFDISILYASGFMEKYLELNFLESLSFLYYKIKNFEEKFDINNVNQTLLRKLFKYYNKINK